MHMNFNPALTNNVMDWAYMDLASVKHTNEDGDALDEEELTYPKRDTSKF